jgi:two-component system, response regulator
MPTLATILIVDDSDNDIVLLRRAFEQEDVKNEVHVCKSGAEALDYLSHASTLPRLMLLDISMPAMNGFEVLRRVKDHPQWRQIITVIFTTSMRPQDKARADELGADSFLTKPMDNDDLRMIVRHFLKEWISE